MHITDSDPLGCTRLARAAIPATTAATRLRQHPSTKEACHGQ